MANKFGFFFEMPIVKQKEVLRSLSRESAHEDEQKIVDYLDAGVSAGATMVVEQDYLKNPPSVVGEGLLKTDGEWLWPDSLKYYVKAYHIEIRPDFVEYMKRNEWSVDSNLTCNPEVPDGHIEM